MDPTSQSPGEDGNVLAADEPGGSTPPRLFGITATAAPVVAVVRRGPSDWCHLGRWDLAAMRYEPGAWMKATIYPQKCDLSPDGRWFAYSALKANADWAAGTVYEAVSRLPWLTALAAWEAGTTYTRGIEFTAERSGTEVGSPDVGDDAPLRASLGLRLTRPNQFAVERRRGWVESAETPPRDDGGHWDEQRSVEMVKPCPAEPDVTLHVAGSYGAFRDSPEHRDPVTYHLEAGDDLEPLDGVQWADWDDGGRLLVATTTGVLEVRALDGPDSAAVVFSEDLAPLRPDPAAPPAWAAEW